MTPLQRVSLQAVLLSFVAGLGLGLLVPYAAEVFTGNQSGNGPVRNYVERATDLLDLTREQQRTLWMIFEERNNEVLKLYRSRSLSELEHEKRKNIARRSHERIMQLLEPAQWKLFLANPADLAGIRPH